MQFILTAYDAKDDGAFARRIAARERHIELLDEMFEEGAVLFGAALLDGDGKMIGSTIVYEVDDRSDLDMMLKVEPYVVDKVWEKWDVQPCKLGPTFEKLYSG